MRIHEHAQLARSDMTQPNIARMYDYVLGGSANVAADRHAADQLLAAAPGNTGWARIVRAFLGRGVRELAARGVDQFLDLGSGLPTRGNVHEVARSVTSSARVAYVDVDPVAAHHARRLLGDDPHTTVTQADVREPQQVLTAPGVAGLLDFTRPVAVIAVAILDLLDTEDPGALVATYRQACVPGSALVLSHSAQLPTADTGWSAARSVLDTMTTSHVRIRDRDQISAMLDGYDLLEPGLVPSAVWRPEALVPAEEAAASNSFGAVGLRR